MGLRTMIASWLLGTDGKALGGVNISPMFDKRPYAPVVNYNALITKYNSWTYACTRLNASSCSQVPLRLYTKVTTKAARKAGTTLNFPTRAITTRQYDYLNNHPAGHLRKAMEVEEVVEHPLLNLLTNVNDFMNQTDLWESVYSYIDLVGNAYWVIGRNENNGRPNEIWPLFPQHMKAITDKEKFIIGWEYNPVGITKIRYDVEEIIHFKNFNPSNAVYGMGALQAAVVAADLGVSMNTFEASMFNNRAQPDYAIVYPPDAGQPAPEEQERMQEEWYKKYGGKKRAGRMGFLFGGADIKRISMTPKEMNYLKGRQATLNELASVFGVPMSKLTVENVNRANAEAGEYAYMKDTVLPKLRKVEQKLNERFVPMYDDRLFVAYDNPVPADKEFRLKEREANLGSGYTSINEERQIDGVGESGWGGVPYLPMNLIPAGSAVVVESSKSKEYKGKVKLPPLSHPTNFIDRAFESKVRSFFKDFEKVFLKSVDDNAEMFKSAADDLVSEALYKFKFEKELEAVLTPFIENTAAFGGEAAIGRVIEGGAFDMTNPKVISALERHRLGAIRNIKASTGKRLRGVVARSMEGGVTDVRNAVEGAFDNIGKYQATVIARTETIWAWNEGNMQGYIQSGQVEKKQWLSSGDDRTCEFCEPMDGKIVGVDESYFGKGSSFEGRDGGTLDFDYEQVDHPPIHPNCRCTIVPVLE